jgi:hypothetical protein
MVRKPFEKLSIRDLHLNPVWEIVTDSDDNGELLVEPITNLPINDLANRIIGSDLTLANGEKRFGLLGNVQLQNEKANYHFLTVSFKLQTRWFTLARYFDPDYVDNGPMELAKKLKMPLSAIFPMRYDISSLAIGKPAALRGEIPEIPKKRLSSEEVVDLAVSITKKSQIT